MNKIQTRTAISLLSLRGEVSLLPKFLLTYQAVQLRNRALVPRLADVPDFNTAFATRVHVSCGVADGNCTHNFPMIQSVDLAGMARDSWTDEGIRRERNRLHLTICSNVKGVGSFLGKRKKGEEKTHQPTTALKCKKKTVLCDLFLCHFLFVKIKATVTNNTRHVNIRVRKGVTADISSSFHLTYLGSGKPH